MEVAKVQQANWTAQEVRDMAKEDADLMNVIHKHGTNYGATERVGWLMSQEELDELEVLRHRKPVNVHPVAACILIGGEAVILAMLGKIGIFSGLTVVLACILMGAGYYIPWKL